MALGLEYYREEARIKMINGLEIPSHLNHDSPETESEGYDMILSCVTEFCCISVIYTL